MDEHVSNWRASLLDKPVCDCGSIVFDRIPNIGLCRAFGWRCIGCKKETFGLPPTLRERENSK